MSCEQRDQEPAGSATPRPTSQLYFHQPPQVLLEIAEQDELSFRLNLLSSPSLGQDLLSVLSAASEVVELLLIRHQEEELKKLMQKRLNPMPDKLRLPSCIPDSRC